MKLHFAVLSLDQSESAESQLSGTGLVIDAHHGAVKCVAAHPLDPYFVTGSDDHTLRIWDCHNFECIRRFKLDEKERPCFLRFSHRGTLLAVGLTTSKIVVMGWDAEQCSLDAVKAVVELPFKADPNKKRSQRMDAKQSDFSTEITTIKWTSDDRHFAAGHIDAVAHIFTVQYIGDDPADDVEAIVPWPSSLAVNNGLVDLQWSRNNEWLLTLTKDQDLMVCWAPFDFPEFKAF